MKKITGLIEKLNLPFAVDKQLHFIVGFLISMVGFFLTGSVLAGIFFSVFFGFAKEFYDSERFDIVDFYFTIGGGIAFALITLIITNYGI